MHSQSPSAPCPAPFETKDLLQLEEQRQEMYGQSERPIFDNLVRPAEAEEPRESRLPYAVFFAIILVYVIL